jgi:hypothetical protein
MIFVRTDTGDAKEFIEDHRTIDETTHHSQRREVVHATYYRSQDRHVIKLMPDGSYQDRYGIVWKPQQ